MEDATKVMREIEPAESRSGRSQHAAQDADRLLLAAVARGEHQAFVTFYDRHAPSVFNYLLRLIHDEKLAEDLLQETFVAVWQGAGKFKRRSKARTWVFRIAHNRAVSWLRRYRPESLEDDSQIPGEEPGPETSVLINWRNEKLLAALDSLSPNHRAVIELAFAQDLTYSEIAQIMRCPIGTVKSRMSYALRRLSQLLLNSDLEP